LKVIRKAKRKEKVAIAKLREFVLHREEQRKKKETKVSNERRGRIRCREGRKRENERAKDCCEFASTF